MDRDELLFNAWLTSVNTRLGRYVVRLVDEACLRPAPRHSVPLVQVERELAEDLTELADAIARKAAGESFPVQSTADRRR
ncbi:hypothetical protein [Saccharothrix coeruleofusca]|uniref:Uncharacterized protein n=1 Tax=Saccharothrix coeruleofusca TaxID=33919 RepID=A0A918ATJ0_9PSEU|nr:hypothetical protein [Saccharothrix coeruleofusca]MBP2336926.1 type II secretory pathway component PulL [Saccharothrix coeruleofusca]GGP81864.1 hypothetical protein GCM10010185_64850 [Saccharothrix coeruleofusca]